MQALAGILQRGDGGVDPFLIGAAGLVAVLLFLIGLLLFGGGQQRKLRRRLERVKNFGRTTIAPSEIVSIRRSTAFSSNKAFNELIKAIVPRPENLRTKLARAGLPFSLGTYLGFNVVIGLAAFVGFRFVPIIPTMAAALLGLLIGVGLPYLLLIYFVARRKRKFVENFPEAIDLMVRGIKSGLPITETIRVVGDEMLEPVGGEFLQVADSIRFGKKLEESLWEMSRRLDIPEFKFFTVSLSIQAETGGNLAETLENLSDVLRRRKQMRLKIKAFASEPKASAYIIGSLPFIMFGLIYMMNAEYVSTLFIDPRGWAMIAGGFLMYIIGIGVMVKLVKFEI